MKTISIMKALSDEWLSKQRVIIMLGYIPWQSDKIIHWRRYVSGFSQSLSREEGLYSYV
jgi:hypothetical protein